jgi:hypothetical protein
MKENIPTGLRQILEVYRLIRWSGYDRLDAERTVAQNYRVTAPTIHSAITRNIGVTAAEIDDLMARGREDPFCEHLIRHFPGYRENINAFFNSFRESSKPDEKDPSLILKALFPDEIKNVLNDFLLNDVREYLSRWVNRTDIPKDLLNEIADLSKKLGQG